MVIKTSFDQLDNAIATVNGVLADKLLQEDLKNVIFMIKGDTVKVVANNFKVTCFADLQDAVVLRNDNEPKDLLTQILAKDIIAVLATLKGLKRTVVTEIELVFKETENLLIVHEEANSDNLVGADKYAQVTKYRLVPMRLKESVKKEVLATDTTHTDSCCIPSADIMGYLDALLPTITKDTRDTPATRINVSTSYLYTVPQVYSAILKNKLPEVFSNFVLTQGVALFLKSFIGLEEYVNFSKEEKNDVVMLKLSNSTAVAIVKAIGISRAFNIDQFIKVPRTGILLDKQYLTDVLKRMSLNTEPVNVHIDVEAEECTLVCKKFTQSLPVLSSNGEGVFDFSIKPDLFAFLILSHVMFDDYVYLLFERDENKGILSMTVKDNTLSWHTKTRGLQAAKGGDFRW